MKNLFLIIALCFSIGLTATNFENSITDETTLIFAYTVDDSILQVTDNPEQSTNKHYGQGLDIYHQTSYRYDPGITSGRYCSYISFNIQTIGNTSKGQISTSHSQFTESWQRNISGMRMYGTETGYRDLQRDYGDATGNHNDPAGNHSANYKPNEFFSEAMFLARIRTLGDFNRYGSHKPISQKAIKRYSWNLS